MRNGELGHWWSSIGGPGAARPSLSGATEADVAIVGAGFTGLWTAYYLKRAQPQLRIVVLEREQAGFGASGRNGGWVSGFFSGAPARYGSADAGGGYRALQRAMFDTVGEVADRIAEHGIDADLARGGHLDLALDRAQLAHVKERLARARALGLGEQDLRLEQGHEVARRLRVAGALAAAYSPHVARVHPAKLVVGLAATLEQLGVEIYEATPVSEIRAHAAQTPAGTVTARWVVRATEGYTSSLRGLRRALAPVNSSMIATEPLDERAWDQIGWEGCELLSDSPHVYVYLQRTADGRIAIGGRGIPYRYASRGDRRGETAPATVAALRAKLAEMFPAAAGAPIAHAWSGVLGVPRDWCVSVDADPSTGVARAGGYVGEGVAAANLAARMLRDLILGERSELARLPWVGRAPRRWEPEPLRWMGIRGTYALYRRADAREHRRGAPSRLGRALDAASGRA